MDWVAFLLSLLIVAGLWWQVRHWVRRAEEQGFVRGWDACSLAQQARQSRQQSQQ